MFSSVYFCDGFDWLMINFIRFRCGCVSGEVVGGLGWEKYFNWKGSLG